MKNYWQNPSTRGTIHSMRSARSISALLGSALAVGVLAASASAQTFPQAVTDSAATSLAPSGLVFTLNSASSLTISYNAQTSAAVVANIKARGFQGDVACSGVANGSTTVDTGTVSWDRSKAAVNVALGGTATEINSCQLSQFADSSQPVIVDFNATERAAAETAVEIAKLPRPVLHSKKGTKGKSLSSVAALLASENPGVHFRVAKGRRAADYVTGVVYLRRAKDGRLVEFQKLANGKFFVQVVSNHGKVGFQAVVNLAHVLAY
jgi:hypothetical protein